MYFFSFLGGEILESHGLVFGVARCCVAYYHHSDEVLTVLKSRGGFITTYIPYTFYLVSYKLVGDFNPFEKYARQI